MIIENGNLVNTGDQILITFDNPFTNVQSIIGYSDVLSVNETENNFIFREFSYSYNNIEFSDYLEVDTLYLNNIDITKNFYIKFRYTKEGTDDTLIVLQDFTFNVVYKIPPKYQNTTCSSACVCANLVSDCEDTFDPYQFDQINCLQNQFNFAVSMRYGHPSTYWRAIPDLESGDVIFKEYSLYNREKGQCLKVVIPDNKLPDNDTQFTMLDMDFLDLPFEVQIAKQEWQRVYGVNSFPKRKDAVYIDILDKMYLVDSSYLFNELGSGKGTYYRVNLIKFQDESNIDMPLDVEQEIRDLIVSSEDIFGEETEAEIEKITKPDQYRVTTFNDLNNYNYTVDRLVKYDTNDKIENNWTLISNSCYNLSNADNINPISYPNHLVSLQKSISIVFWIKLLDTTFTSIKALKSGKGFSVGFNSKNLTLKINDYSNTYDTSMLQLNTWYGVVINLSEEFKQVNTNIYKLGSNNVYANTENVDSKLIKVFSDSTLITDDMVFENIVPTVTKGKYKITNIRIFDKMVPEINQNSILTQNIVVDNDKSMLIDNAIEPIKLIQQQPHR